MPNEKLNSFAPTFLSFTFIEVCLDQGTYLCDAGKIDPVSQMDLRCSLVQVSCLIVIENIQERDKHIIISPDL